jgi:hypothetical protein
MRPGTERTLKARELAARMLDKFGWIPEPTRRWIYVVAQGFAAIAQYPRNVADGVMVEDFRRRDYNYRVRREEIFQQAEAESDGSLDEERWRAEALDLAQSVALDAWDYGAKAGSGKGRPTVTVKEVPWSQSSAH